MKLALSTRHKGSMLHFAGLPLAKVLWNFIAFILLFIPFSFWSSEPNQPIVNLYFSKKDSTTNCRPPIFNLTSEDVSNSQTNDAKITISNIQNGLKYDFSSVGTSQFNYNNAKNIDPKNLTIDITGLPNPTTTTQYFVRVYRTETCFSDQNITLEHINFANFTDNNSTKTDLEIAQSVSNSSPNLDSIVTFSTVVSNKSKLTATGVEVTILPTNGLKIIGFDIPKGKYDSKTGIWQVGDLNGGEVENLQIKAQVTQQGLSYVSAQITKVNEADPDSSPNNNDPTEDDYGLSCVSIPIQLKDNDSYKVSLNGYNGVKWYRSVNGELEEITAATSASVAVINSDTSLTIKSSGEYSFSRLRGNCTIHSCCPIKIEGCQVPEIAIDSVFCQSNNDSYSVKVKLQSAEAIAQTQAVNQVLGTVFGFLGIKANFVKINSLIPANSANSVGILTLTASAGTVIDDGNNVFTVENIPMAKQSVTLTAKSATGVCGANRLVNAPNCQQPNVPEPIVSQKNISHCIGTAFPELTATAINNNSICWFSGDKFPRLLYVGAIYKPQKSGTYYCAALDSVAKAMSQKVAITITDVANPEPPSVRSLITCQNNKMLLMANGCDGTVNWYKGDSLLASGENFMAQNYHFLRGYDVICKDENGCQSNPRSLANIALGEQISQPMVSAICEGTVGKVTVLPFSPDFQYSMSAGKVFQTDNIFRNVRNGVYQVVMKIKNQNECQSDPLEITVHCDCTNICVPFEIKKVTKNDYKNWNQGK